MLLGMSHPPESRRLYVADLARRQFEMESGRQAMQPLAYRVLSKRLREALAGLPGIVSRPPDSVLFSPGVRTRFGL